RSVPQGSGLAPCSPRNNGGRSFGLSPNSGGPSFAARPRIRNPVALSSLGFARRTNSLPTNLVNFGPLSPHCFVRSGVFVKECHRITTKPPSYWGVLALHPSEAGLR